MFRESRALQAKPARTPNPVRCAAFHLAAKPHLVGESTGCRLHALCHQDTFFSLFLSSFLLFTLSASVPMNVSAATVARNHYVRVSLVPRGSNRTPGWPCRFRCPPALGVNTLGAAALSSVLCPPGRGEEGVREGGSRGRGRGDGGTSAP